MNSADLYHQAAELQDERRGWHEASMQQFADEGVKHRAATRFIGRYMLARAAIEFGILIMLVVLAV